MSNANIVKASTKENEFNDTVKKIPQSDTMKDDKFQSEQMSYNKQSHGYL